MATAKAQSVPLLTRILRPFVNFGRFLRDVHLELQRVVWPSHEETYSFTVVVIIAVTIVAAWVAILDVIFASFMHLLGLAK